MLTTLDQIQKQHNSDKSGRLLKTHNFQVDQLRHGHYVDAYTMTVG